MKSRKLLQAAAALALAGVCATASAELYSNDFGSLVPGYVPNDDNTFGPVALPFTLNFFGTNYTSTIVSNNGNIQFGTNSGAYISSPLNTTTDFRGIAPFWSDLISWNEPPIVAGTGGSGVYFRQISASEVLFTWDRLGFYSNDYSARVQFQLVLRDPNAAIPAGEGAIGFYYGPMAGQTGGRTAAAGFGDGASAVNPGEISVYSGLATDAATYLNGQAHIWFNLSGTGVPETPPPVSGVPEPSTYALLALGLGLFGVVARRRKAA